MSLPSDKKSFRANFSNAPQEERISPECRFKALEIPFSEWVEVICIHTILLGSLVTNSASNNLRVRKSSIGNEPS